MSYQIMPEAEGVWNLRSTVTKQPVQLANYKRYIPSFLINGEFNSQFVAVGIRVTASGENWRFGGFLAQEFTFPASGYREANRGFFCTEELLINNVTVLKLPVATGEPFKLRFFPPTWFPDLTLQIWEYTGPVIDGEGGSSPDITQQLAEIKNLVSVGFIDLNNRLDREDVPAKLTSISYRLERIERALDLDTGTGLFSSSASGSNSQDDVSSTSSILNSNFRFLS